MSTNSAVQKRDVTFTAVGGDQWRCDLCGKEVRGYRGRGGHIAKHTGKAKEKFQRRGRRSAGAVRSAAVRSRDGGNESARLRAQRDALVGFLKNKGLFDEFLDSSPEIMDRRQSLIREYSGGA